MKPVSFDSWHTTELERTALANELMQFLRTHNDAGWRLTEWMRSVAPDHTEEEHDRAWRARTLQSVR